MEQEIKQDAEGLTFRPMTLEDIPAVMVIEHDAFTLPWTEEAFRNELTHNHFARYMMMEWNGEPVGYAGMWTVIDEAHVTNIAVLSPYRGRKWGERLLLELMKTASQLGMKRMTLEVRVSNRVAQNLYMKMGFEPAGLRKGYYSDNQEDAMIMWAELFPDRSQNARG
ncbi:ribosomal protein S18-alanine N-acetyltransferase [Paenibacillus cellulositrophicus]|jgi:ribosomal-protein-alanine N-acetyltransferase|uniref:Ribosomal-protein-alanine acetyltransferase n=1 Tax=Paenibacillus cineris TaxID=237530 RepID=A0ABQ4L688_9BACL|nr:MULTISPECIES: ribosomal protein S18-alanine N-acetyltransferase [Paenibacillus]MBJ9991524.1 ribosomal protein S18-alanine N-acetyltransferase [Paenibacillus sp. S28]MCM2995996.1 ribosomal protein S18-alanine N-acetyltransferase [Paenibacillus cellulositrophicus]OXL87388.1 ribosomal-protein-alanine N-acetyltransferase [Paenibacillus sp. SSG-1]PQP90826.1 ribosomal-protein-alanine N-acetyltransferase [Paenibacillus sp. AR247]RED36415.1 [SSU ribosomal protein S18P]-alanine acetyltransferase [Pa